MCSVAQETSQTTVETANPDEVRGGRYILRFALSILHCIPGDQTPQSKPTTSEAVMEETQYVFRPVVRSSRVTDPKNF